MRERHGRRRGRSRLSRRSVLRLWCTSKGSCPSLKAPARREKPRTTMARGRKSAKSRMLRHCDSSYVLGSFWCAGLCVLLHDGVLCGRRGSCGPHGCSECKLALSCPSSTLPLVCPAATSSCQVAGADKGTDCRANVVRPSWNQTGALCKDSIRPAPASVCF